MLKSNHEDSMTTYISKETRITGTIAFSGSMQVEGEISGDVIAAGDSKSELTVLQHGKVTGEVRVPLLTVSGQIKGDVYASQQLVISSKGIIEGRVYYKNLEVNKGATISGEIGTNPKAADKQQAQPKEKRAAGAAV